MSGGALLVRCGKAGKVAIEKVEAALVATDQFKFVDQCARKGLFFNLFAHVPSDTYVVDFLGTREGLELNKAFSRISDPKVRKAICDLVKALGGEES